MLLLLSVAANAKKHRPTLNYDAEDLQLLFGPTGCIEGLFYFSMFNNYY